MHQSRHAANLPAFSKPAYTPKHTRKPAAKKKKSVGRLVVGATLKTAAFLIATCVLAAGIWAHNLGREFDETRNIVDLNAHDNNDIPVPETEHNQQADEAPATEEPVEEHDGSINILLLGVDDTAEDNLPGQHADQRTDTMMVAHIPEDRSGVYLISLVRDLYINIPGSGEDRINNAYSIGGLQLTMNTVESLLDINLDHIAIIDFDGFAGLTDALGGVTIDNPVEFEAGQNNPTTFPEGEITISGNDALRYVRERKSFPESDFMRVENQQRVLQAIMDEMLTPDTLSNPSRIQDIVTKFTPYISVDEDLDSSQIVSYAASMTHLRGSDVESFTIPVDEPHTTPGGAEVILPDEDAILELSDALNDGTVNEYLEDEHEEDLPDGIDGG